MRGYQFASCQPRSCRRNVNRAGDRRAHRGRHRGASGIGRTIAGRLAEEGADVRIVDVAAADEAVEEICGSGDAESYVADVTDLAAIGRAFEQPRWHLDFLVNVAGIFSWEDALDPERDGWDRTLAVNLGGVMTCCRAAAPGMLARGFGRIVNISSNAAIIGFRHMPAYTAAKAGIVGLTMSLAVDLGRHAITVNAVAPGSIATGMGETSGWTSDPRVRAWD